MEPHATNWVSGERVFAPPQGTLDLDWLVPAVQEAVPGTSVAAALEALAAARARLENDEAGPGVTRDRLAVAADLVVGEAVRSFDVRG